MKILIFLLALIAVTGCGFPQQLLTDRSAALLFDQGLEELAGTGRTETLQALTERFPDSRWSSRGQIILGQNQKLKSAEKSLTGCKRETNSCQAELTRARNDLEELKRLVIEMELKTRPGKGKKN